MKLRRAAKPILLALCSTLCAGAAIADDARSLITSSPANRSARSESIRAIVGLVAERSTSRAVRERAKDVDLAGRLTVGVDEVLAEIGATAALDMPRTIVASPVVVAPPVIGQSPVDTNSPIATVATIAPDPPSTEPSLEAIPAKAEAKPTPAVADLPFAAPVQKPDRSGKVNIPTTRPAPILAQLPVARPLPPPVPAEPTVLTAPAPAAVAAAREPEPAILPAATSAAPSAPATEPEPSKRRGGPFLLFGPSTR